MLNVILPCLPRVLLLWLCLLPNAQALTLPLFVKYSMMQQLLLQYVFTGPNHSAELHLNDIGCATVHFTQPHLSGAADVLQLRAHVAAEFGMPGANGQCVGLKQWSGRAEVQGKPLIQGAECLAVKFAVMNIAVFDAQGQPLTNGIMKTMLEGQLQPYVEKLVWDFKPQLKQMVHRSPLAMLGYSAQQWEQLITRFRLGDIHVRSDGLAANVQTTLNERSLLEFLPKQR